MKAKDNNIKYDYSVAPTVRKGLRLRLLTLLMILLACAVFFLFYHISSDYTNQYYAKKDKTDEYVNCQIITSQLIGNFDKQYVKIYDFVKTSDMTYLDEYFNITNTIDDSLNRISATLRNMNISDSSVSIKKLSLAFSEVKDKNDRIILLACDAYGYKKSDLPSYFKNEKLSDEDLMMTDVEKVALAKSLLTDSAYMVESIEFRSLITSFFNILTNETVSQQNNNHEMLFNLINNQGLLNIVLLFMIVLFNLLIYTLVMKPIINAVSDIDNDKKLKVSGSYEMRILAESYNNMYDMNLMEQRELTYKSTHDALTGLNNRGVFDQLCIQAKEKKLRECCMIMLDIDGFKQINDTLGHDVGDMALKKVAESLMQAFSSIGYVCRVGGDEFGIVITDKGVADKEMIVKQLEKAFQAVCNAEGRIPALTLSAGLVFGTDEGRDYDLYKHADTALYASKKDNTVSNYIYYADIKDE